MAKKKIKPYTYKKDGKPVHVKAHVRNVADNTVTVTRAEYKAKSEKRSKDSLKRDKSRTKNNAVSGNKAKLPKNWNTKDYDWIGIDAKGYNKIPSDNKKLSGGIPGYSIVKFNIKGKPRYYPLRGSTKIGPTVPHTSIESAKRVIKTHYGRATGKIKNIRTEDRHARILSRDDARNPYRMRDDPNVDYDSYDDSEDYHDSSISHHENLGLQKSRYSFREQSLNWR
jgi:hypothetical protein